MNAVARPHSATCRLPRESASRATQNPSDPSINKKCTVTAANAAWWTAVEGIGANSLYY